ncbi:MAG TPA: YggT family protein [Gemmatimonadaceae bacterium]|jgi:YggT family protein|nr:YggT family protein [Gemmatimonadaceae bacterium]
MTDALLALAALSQVLRSVFLVAGVALAAVAAADWAVRTRRLNPFGGVARFLRARVDPRLVGVERQVLRAGGRPSTTPWWALLLYIVAALLVLYVLNTIAALVYQLELATSLGGLGLVRLVVHWTIGILQLALIVRVIASWIPRISTSRWIRWSYGATDWMLRPLRNLLPSFGVIDITPIVAYFALWLVQLLADTILLGAPR